MTKPIFYQFFLLAFIIILNGCTNHQQPKKQHDGVTHTHDLVHSNTTINSGKPTVPRARDPSLVNSSVNNSSTSTYNKPKSRPFRVQVNPSEIVSAHNRVRAKYRLQPLSWSPSLSKFSAQWANHLKRNNGCRMVHRPHEGRNKTDYGENLFWASPYRWSDGATNIQKITSSAVVQAWASEVKYYDYSRNSCQPGQQCGHFKQVIWKDSRKVGCALAVCADKSQVWVCSYDPPGNWQGVKPY